MGRTWMQLLVGWCLLLTAAVPLAVGQADPLYDAALNDFRANRIRDAAKNLRIILQKDPKNASAAMLLGTMYYQNHNLKKAYYWFERGDPNLLSNDTAFAWGSTYMEFDDDKKAALGFRYILKNKGPFRPFATYYLGVIAYKSAQWLKARKYFQKVNPEDLTVTLRVNRRRYLADIRRQQEKMLESVISGVDKTSQDITSTQPTVDPPKAKDTGGPEEELGVKPTAVAAEEQKGWRSGYRPSLALTQQNQLLDNHGLNHDNVNLFARRAGFGGAVNYGDERRGGAGVFGGLDYHLGDIGYSAKLEQVQYFTLDDTSGVFTSETSATEDLNSGFLIVQPHIGWYLNERMRFELNLGVRSYFPEYDGKQVWGQTTEQLGARYEDGETEVGVELALLQPFDETQKKSAVDLAGRVELERQFGEVRVNVQAYGWKTDQPKFLSQSRFRLILADPQLRYRTGFESEVGASGALQFNIFSDASLQLRFESLQRQAPSGVRINRLRSVDGVESVAYGAFKSLASMNVPLGDSASLTGSAAFHQLADYHYTDFDEQGGFLGEYTSDVQQVIYQVGGTISFAEWIRLSGTYTLTSNDYVSKGVANGLFKRRNPNYIVDSGIYLELAKSF